MGFDPDTITQDKLHELRSAAEHAWGDETRHPDFQGHPQASAGQCFVTSQWLADKLGGFVGTKHGHYFWVSPDKQYVIDLTGDENSYEPTTAKTSLLDEDDEPYDFEPEQKRHRSGPIIYTRADSPLYRDFRIKTYPDHPRAETFARRANAALERGIPKQADSGEWGDAYPGEEPQANQDFENRYFHDTRSDLELSMEKPNEKEYKFFYGNGQLHVSPMHSHDELRDHSGTPANHEGPMAVGYVTVRGRDALWSVEGNIALRGLVKELQDYGKRVGWTWGGLVDGSGQPIHDDFGAKKSYWYTTKGGLKLSEAPFRGSKGRIVVEGKMAKIQGKLNPAARAGLEEWADDFGLRLAEYPGGTDMNDRMKNKEWTEEYDKGNPEAEPQKAFDGEPQGELTCSTCGVVLPNFRQYVLHNKQHDPLDAAPAYLDDGHFPTLNDKDDVLPLRLRNSEPTAQPLASFREASTVEDFDLYSKLWGYNRDEGYVFYGGYLDGQIVGYGVVRPGEDEAEVVMVHSAVHNRGVGTALLQRMLLHYPNAYTHADSPEGERLVRRMGMVNTSGHRYVTAAGGKEPKDLLEAPLPFVYDIDKDYITVGHPGMKTSDIMGQFTPGGIVEGYYEPGGKIVINTTTTMPYSTYHMMQLWYWSHPHMEITSLELENQQGKAQKLATADVGSYVKTLTAADGAAWNAFQALRKAGGHVYVVGGAIRDALLQKEPRDIDFMVSGLPAEQVENVLDKLPGSVNWEGKRFGTYKYRTKGQEVEIALPRTDTYEEGGRRGQGKITVDHNLPVEKDLARRDFTANSMAVDLETGRLVDPYGGAKDIESHTLRTTHPDSFDEDPTRLVRALVAASRHGLVPDERTRKEMEEHAYRLDNESPDALKQQLDKLLASPNPAGALRLAQETGVLHHMFPELANNFDYDQRNPHHNYSLGEHSLNVLDNVSHLTDDPEVRLAALLHDVGKPASSWVDPATEVTHYYPGMIDGQPVGADHAKVGADIAEQRLRETYNYPVSKIRNVHNLISHHMFPAFSSPKGARKFLNRVGDAADDLLTLRRGDMTGKGQTPEEVAARTSVDKMHELVEGVRHAGAPTNQSMISVNGDDLQSLGLKPGPQIGTILRQLTNRVVESPQDNARDRLLQLAREYINALPDQPVRPTGPLQEERPM